MNLNLKIEYNELSEYQRYIFICMQVFRGFYQSKRFYLTHELLKLEERQVYVPKVDITKIPTFWKDIEDIVRDMYKEDVGYLANMMRQNDIEIKSISEQEITEFKRRIEGFLKEVMKDVVYIFPQIQNKEINITVKPSLYGTNGSFDRPIVTKNTINIRVTLRVDKPNDYLLEIIMSSLVWVIKYEKNKKLVKWQEDWEINESIVDFMLKHTLLQKYSPNYIGTMDVVENPETYYLNLIETSKNIFNELGYPINRYIEMENNEVLINGEPPKKSFTDQEKKIIKKLTESKGRLISNDELEETLWGNDFDKHSLWALAKVMQRIRNKIKQSGIASEIIQTVRGKGYLIYD